MHFKVLENENELVSRCAILYYSVKCNVAPYAIIFN